MSCAANRRMSYVRRLVAEQGNHLALREPPPPPAPRRRVDAPSSARRALDELDGMPARDVVGHIGARSRPWVARRTG